MISSAITQRSRAPGQQLRTINNNNTKNGNNKNVINNYTKITTTLKRRTLVTNKQKQLQKNIYHIIKIEINLENTLAFVGENNNINNNSINIENEWRTSNSMKAHVCHGLFRFSLWSCWWTRSANTVCVCVILCESDLLDQSSLHYVAIVAIREWKNCKK